jgi:hypothetical protein
MRRSSRKMRSLALALTLATLTGLGSVVAAADPPCTKEEGTVQVVRGPAGQKKFILKKGIVIRGVRQKPNAFYVLERSRVRYDRTERQEPLVLRILAPLGHSPF